MGCERGQIESTPMYTGSVLDVCPVLAIGQKPPQQDGTITSVDLTDDEQTNPVNFDGTAGFNLGDGANPLWTLTDAPVGIYILQDGIISGRLTEDITVTTDYFPFVTYTTDAGTASAPTFKWTVTAVVTAEPAVAGFVISWPENTLVATDIQGNFTNADAYILNKIATPPGVGDASQPIANLPSDSITLQNYNAPETWYLWPLSIANGLVGTSQFATPQATDTNPPVVPFGFAMVAGPNPSTEITCSWPTVSDAESGIDRTDLMNGSFEVVAAGVTSPHTETGLDPGTSYLWFVEAYDKSGNSTQSNADQLDTSSGAANLFSSIHQDWQSNGEWVDDGITPGTFSGTAMSNGSDVYQDISSQLTLGNTYRISCTIVTISAGWLRFQVGGKSGDVSLTAPGDYTEDILIDGSIFAFTGVSTGGGATVKIQASDAGTGNEITIIDLGVI